MAATEKFYERQILDWLNLNGFFCWKNYDQVRRTDLGKFRRPEYGQVKGIPDIIALKDGITYFIEVKTPKGRQSIHQMAFEHEIVRHGGHYVVARSYKDVEQYVRTQTSQKVQTATRQGS